MGRPLRTALARLDSWACERLPARPVTLDADRPVFSFTFDDVPASALRHGVPLLESAGIAATVYVAAQLADPAGCREQGEYASLEDVAALASRGHQIGCHSFSHYPLQRGCARDLHWDALRNRLALREALGGAEVEDFSYPFGAVSLAARRLLASRYASLRGTRPGVNHGVVDLALLRAVNLYSRTLDRRRLEAWIERCAALRGWLIFYTHGVEAEPDAFGTTPEDLRWVAERCAAVGGEILSVREARGRLWGAASGS